jgi:hypothetical protein
MATLSTILRWGPKSALLCYASLAYSAQPVTDLLKSADLVVIGAPISFAARTGSLLIDLSIIQWLSPPPSGAPASLQVLWTAPTSKGQPLAPTGAPRTITGIWFLKSHGDNTYTVLKVRTGKAPLTTFTAADRGTCPGTLTYPPDAPLTDKIALELACAATKESGPPGSSAESMVDGTYGLGTSPRVHDAFLYLAQLPGSRQKAVGIACLIAAQDPVGPALLEQHVQELTDYDLQTIVASRILSWRNTDPAAIRSLGRVATGSQATGGLLFYASVALSEIHTADTLPYFRLLLDNPDRSIRIRAIGAFGRFVMGSPVHTPENSLTMEFMKSSPTPYANEPLWRQFPSISPNPSDAELQAVGAFLKKWLNSHPELPQ